MSVTRHGFFTRHLLAASALVLLTTAMPALAQGRPVVLDGKVQWISANTMMVTPQAGGPPISIDLSKVPQDSYAGLVLGDPVMVNGSYDGHRILATWVALTAEPLR